MKGRSFYAACVGVLALLLVLGYNFWPADRRHSYRENPLARAHSPPRQEENESSDGAAVIAAAKDTAPLDQIAGAPLQQVHNLLASRSREDIVRLAQHLRELQPGALSNA